MPLSFKDRWYLLQLLWGAQGLPVGTFRHRLKATICIILGRAGPAYEDLSAGKGMAIVWISSISPIFWTEIAVSYGWRDWWFYEYDNGIY